VVKETLVVMQVLLRKAQVAAVVVKLRLVVMVVLILMLVVLDLLVKVGKDINLQ
tara:strand:- start:4 stop:165 length:162 start_codon:yes stop_codon:yes gene_type:complete